MGGSEEIRMENGLLRCGCWAVGGSHSRWLSHMASRIAAPAKAIKEQYGLYSIEICVIIVEGKFFAEQSAKKEL